MNIYAEPLEVSSVFISSADTDIYVNQHHNNARGYFTAGSNVGIVVKVDLKKADGTIIGTKYDELIAAPSHIAEDYGSNVSISSVGSDSSSTPTGFTKAGTATIYSSTNSVTFKANGEKYYIALDKRS